MTRNPIVGIILLLLAAWVYASGGTMALPSIPWPSVPSIIAPANVTAVTYIYEKDAGGIPPAVSAALGELNAAGIRATTFEEDTLDASGQVPEQYKLALPAAREAGLPSLVVMSGETVVRVVKQPTTKEAVLEASK